MAQPMRAERRCHPGLDATVPSSTYRIQLSNKFTFDQVASCVPFLARLRISHLVLSPIYRSRPESPHGYDIVDHSCIDDDLGGRAAWQRLRSVLQTYEMAVVLDVVPNHMAADPVHNRLWREVLRNGQSSFAAPFFDIDWRPLTGLVRDKVLLPLLEVPYGEALIKGQVALERSEPELQVRCGGLSLPLSPRSIEAIVATQDVDAAIDQINSDPARLHELLEQQNYRLAYWRAANDDINYRRFVGVNELIAIRAEDHEVADRSQRLVVNLVEDGNVEGLRSDQGDGAPKPFEYLQRLQAAFDNLLRKSPSVGRRREGSCHGEHLNLHCARRRDYGIRRARCSQRPLRQPARRADTSQVLSASDRRVRVSAGRSTNRSVRSRKALRSGMTILVHELKRLADASWTTLGYFASCAR